MANRWKHSDEEWLAENSFMFTLVELAEVLHRSTSAIRNKCEVMGVGLKKTKRRLKQEDVASILRLCRDGLCQHKVAEKLGWSRSTTHRVCKRAGLKVGSCTCLSSEKTRMRAARVAGAAGKLSAKELALRWGLSLTGAREYASKTGVELRLEKRKWLPEEDEYIQDKFPLGVDELVKDLDRTDAAVRQRCWDLGLYIKLPCGEKIRGVTNIMKDAHCSRRLFYRAVKALDIPYSTREYHKRGTHRFTEEQYSCIVDYIKFSREITEPLPVC